MLDKMRNKSYFVDGTDPAMVTQAGTERRNPMADEPEHLALAVLVAPGPAALQPQGVLRLTGAATSRESLREGLRHAIELGELKPGSRLKRGNDLARAIGLSRSTVGAAVFDLVHEGLLEQCPGGGKVVSEREPGPRLRIVPCVEGLDLPLEEYSSVLAFTDDQVDPERSWRQFLHGRCVAEVRIRSDARWWAPPPRLRWGERLGPGRAVTDVSVRVGQVVDEHAERWLTVAVDYASASARCAVRMRLADRLFSVELS
jgi:hypothetical protein